MSISPPEPTGAAAAACETLHPALPSTVDDATARTTTPESPFTAAWGDIVLTCGGPPADVDPMAQLVTIDEVDWYPEQLPQGGTRFTTVKRVANVVVIVPSSRQPAANAAADLSAAVAQHVPPVEQR